MSALTLRRLAIATPALAAGLAVASVVVAEAAVWSVARTLVPLVFAVTIALEWAVDLDTEEGLLHLVFDKLESLWDSAGAGFYGVVAAATFVRLEAVTLAEEWTEAGSARAFFESELFETLIGFSMDSLFNSIEAGIWFVGWLDLPTVEALGLGAACFAAYGLGRWAWPDDGPSDTLETALERLTGQGP